MPRHCLFTTAGAAALAASMLAAAAPASATVFITDYKVTATYAAGLPFSSLSATYTLRYDSSVSVQSNAITLAAFSLVLDGVHYDLSNVGKQLLLPVPPSNIKTLQIGGDVSGAFGIQQNTDDFLFTFAYQPNYTDTATGGIFPSPSFQVAAPNVTGVRSQATLTVTRLSTTATPEPATWAMLIAGFGLVGAALRRGRAAGRRGSGRPRGVSFGRA